MNIILPHPIERIRGGEIVVTVECTDNGKTVSSFAIAKADTEEAIQEAMDSAINKCRAILEKELLPKLEEAIISIYEESVVKMHEKQSATGALDDETMAMLKSLTDEHKQRELNGLCEVLGIAKIDAQARGYTMLQTISLISGFKKWAKSLESKA